MDELFSKQMPHSAEAEQAVLGSMLIDSRCVPDVIGIVKGEDFYIQHNRDIFDTIYSMFNYSQTIDPVTVLDQMRVNGVINENSSNYILDLMTITPTATNASEYATIVRDLSMRRALAAAGGEIEDMAMDGTGEPADVLELAERKIYSLRQGRSNGGLMPISEVLVGVYSTLSEAYKGGAKIPGTTTGFPALDSSIMGLNNSDLIIIASRPGMGKTSLALAVALRAAQSSGKSVAVFSLEMSREQLCMRLLSGESFVDSKKLQSGQLTKDDWRSVAAAAASLSGVSILIDDNPTLSVADMNAQCRRVKNLGLVVVDYLQLMQSSGSSTKYSGENRTQVISDISRMLKIMAKELNVPVICLSQLSRANESRTNRRPMLSDLRESGAIEQDADIVIGLYRDDYYNKETETPNITECIIMKNRRGETGTVTLGWKGECTTFYSIDTIHTEG